MMQNMLFQYITYNAQGEANAYTSLTTGPTPLQKTNRN